MNKVLFVSIISILAVPTMISAMQGNGEMGEPGMPQMMEHADGALPPMMGSGEKRPPMMFGSGTRPPMMGSGGKFPPMMGSGEKRPPMMFGSGTRPPMMGSGEVRPPKEPNQNGNQELRGLTLAIGKLPPEKRKELLQIIKKYLEENSVKPGNSQKESPKTGSGGNGEGKKEYVGHVSLMK